MSKRWGGVYRMKKYERCSKCDKLLPIIKTKRTYDTLCKTCVKAKLFEMHKNKMPEWKPSIEVETEERFEDDPRAIREQDYGRVSRISTYVFSRTILDDFG